MECVENCGMTGINSNLSNLPNDITDNHQKVPLLWEFKKVIPMNNGADDSESALHHSVFTVVGEKNAFQSQEFSNLLSIGLKSNTSHPSEEKFINESKKDALQHKNFVNCVNNVNDTYNKNLICGDSDSLCSAIDILSVGNSVQSDKNKKQLVSNNSNAKVMAENQPKCIYASRDIKYIAANQNIGVSDTVYEHQVLNCSYSSQLRNDNMSRNLNHQQSTTTYFDNCGVRSLPTRCSVSQSTDSAIKADLLSLSSNITSANGNDSQELRNGNPVSPHDIPLSSLQNGNLILPQNPTLTSSFSEAQVNHNHSKTSQFVNVDISSLPHVNNYDEAADLLSRSPFKDDVIIAQPVVAPPSKSRWPTSHYAINVNGTVLHNGVSSVIAQQSVKNFQRWPPTLEDRDVELKTVHSNYCMQSKTFASTSDLYSNCYTATSEDNKTCNVVFRSNINSGIANENLQRTGNNYFHTGLKLHPAQASDLHLYNNSLKPEGLFYTDVLELECAGLTNKKADSYFPPQINFCQQHVNGGTNNRRVFESNNYNRIQSPLKGFSDINKVHSSVNDYVTKLPNGSSSSAVNFACDVRNDERHSSMKSNGYHAVFDNSINGSVESSKLSSHSASSIGQYNVKSIVKSASSSCVIEEKCLKSAETDNSQTKLSMLMATPESKRYMVNVAKFPYYTTEKEIFDLFRRFGARSVYMKNTLDRNKQTLACVFFASCEEAEKAQREMANYNFKGHQLKANLGQNTRQLVAQQLAEKMQHEKGRQSNGNNSS